MIDQFNVEEVEVTEATYCNRCGAYEMMTMVQSRASGYSASIKIGKCVVCNADLVVEG